VIFVRYGPVATPAERFDHNTLAHMRRFKMLTREMRLQGVVSVVATSKIRDQPRLVAVFGCCRALAVASRRQTRDALLLERCRAASVLHLLIGREHGTAIVGHLLIV